MKKTDFFTFCSELKGFRFFTKKTNKEVFKYQLYFSGYDIDCVFKKFNVQPRIQKYNN